MRCSHRRVRGGRPSRPPLAPPLVPPLARDLSTPMAAPLPAVSVGRDGSASTGLRLSAGLSRAPDDSSARPKPAASMRSVRSCGALTLNET